jgi:flagellar L-ring protein precursor FlgH
VRRWSRRRADGAKAGAAALILTCAAAPASAQNHDKAAQLPAKASYQELYERYLASARQLPPAPSLWMADLAIDPTARRVNDLVTIRVLESLSATGSANSTTSKESNSDVSIPAPRIAKELARLFPNSSETKFNGAGSTTRTTELSATITARVVEVLPNGDLVVEGVREVDINGDRSVVVLTGVIRPFDVQPGNVIASTRIGQLRIRSLSQGLIKDSLSPGWLIRILNKIF